MNRFLSRSLLLLALAGPAALAQTLYVPGGSVGNISGSNVGIGTSSPGAPFEVRRDTSSGTLGGRIAINNFASASYASVALDMNVTNIGTNDPQTRIQATDNADWSANLIFLTKTPGANSNTLAERMRITSAGNIGIGTTTPHASLEVFANASSSTANLMLTSGQDRTPRIRFNGPWSISNPSESYAQIVAVNDNGGPGNSAASLHFYTSSGDPAVLADKMVITGAGNVGIGNANPVSYAALDVNTTGLKSIHAMDSSNGGLLIGYNGPTIQARTTTDANSANLILQYWGGYVGIGTMNPTYPLTVNGAVRAKEVIVDTGWSDYVFKPEYRLAPLHEVEKTIATEGHLPGIPSAKEVAEHGISVGEMQAKLLAKIEELTLHQIAQEKEQAQLRERVNQLEKENSSLRTTLDSLHTR